MPNGLTTHNPSNITGSEITHLVQSLNSHLTPSTALVIVGPKRRAAPIAGFLPLGLLLVRVGRIVLLLLNELLLLLLLPSARSQLPMPEDDLACQGSRWTA